MATVVTGVTGVLGSSLCSSFGDDVYFIVRDGLLNMRLPDFIEPTRVLRGDIVEPLCGLSQNDIERLNDIGITRFIHLAANVSFAVNDPNGEIWNVNYNLTKNALDLAKSLYVTEFLHCSTVYSEDQRNPYEKSKYAAEQLVVNSGLTYSIIRPSAMVGDSVTGETFDFNGYYGVYVYFHIMAERSRKKSECIDVSIPVYVVCSKKSTINHAYPVACQAR